RTGGSHGPVSVQVSTSDVTAVAGQDYVTVSQVVSWADGDASPKTVTIPVRDDNHPGEGNAVVRLTLDSPGGGASLGSRAGATLTIREDNEPFTVAVPPPVVQRVGKRGVPTAIVVTLNGPLDPTTANDAAHYNIYLGGKLQNPKRKQKKLVNVL